MPRKKTHTPDGVPLAVAERAFEGLIEHRPGDTPPEPEPEPDTDDDPDNEPDSNPDADANPDANTTDDE